jgi:hypothetical protein
MARPLGAKNRLGAQVKENIVAVFTRLGGTAAMADWARENLTEFYKLYGRLIPSEVIGEFTIRDATELSDAELASIATGGRIGTSSAPTGGEEPGELH